MKEILREVFGGLREVLLIVGGAENLWDDFAGCSGV